MRGSDSQDKERGKTDREVGRGGERKNRGRRRKGPHKFLSPLSLMALEVLATSASPSRQRPHCKALHSSHLLAAKPGQAPASYRAESFVLPPTLCQDPTGAVAQAVLARASL